jgi:hypothetical protein
LNKPVTVKYRNESADVIMTAMIQLKNELNPIGNNINQAVKITYTEPDFRVQNMADNA